MTRLFATAVRGEGTQGGGAGVRGLKGRRGLLREGESSQGKEGEGEENTRRGATVATGESTQALEALGHRRCKPPFTAQIRDHELIERRRRLVAPVRPTALLHRLVGAEWELHGDVDPAPLVANGDAGMQADSSAGSVTDDGYIFAAVHEAPALVDV